MMEDAFPAINHVLTFGLATFVLITLLLKDWIHERRKRQAQQQKIIDAISGSPTTTTLPPPIPPDGKKVSYNMKRGAQRYAVYELDS